MTDYAALKAEIALPQYGSMTDAQIAASLTSSITVPADADTLTAHGIMMRSATYDWGRVVGRSRMSIGGTTDNVILAATNFVAAFESGAPMLHTSQADALAKLQTDLSILQTSGDISQASADAVLALTTAQTTRAAQLGFNPAIHDMEQEIAAARIWTP